jgi:hypothetical protein
MTWPVKALYLTVGVVLLGVVAYWMGRCAAPDPPPSDYGPAAIDTVEVVRFLPDPDPSLTDRLRYSGVDARASGEATLPPSGGDYVSRSILERDTTLSASIRDTLTPVYPLLRIETRAERGLKLGIERSDGKYVVRDYDCRHPCRVDAMGDTILARDARQVPGLAFLKDLPLCAGAGALAGGIAWAASAPEPLAIGAAGGAGCVLFRLTQ